MGDQLTKQDKIFVKEIVEHGNQTEAAIKAYNYKNRNTAGVQAKDKLRNPKIQNAIQSLADRIPDDKLHQVMMEGLEATKPQGVGGMAMNISKNGIDSIGHSDMFIADYATRHKYLDTALKLKGAYETDENKNINILMPVLVKFLDKKDDSDKDTTK